MQNKYKQLFIYIQIKDIISLLKLSSEPNHNSSQKSLSYKNENENNNNEYFNFDYFDGLNEDNQNYYENFYPKD